MANLLINAGPGAGKTYSLIQSYVYCRTKYPERITMTEEQKEIFEWCKYNLPQSKSVAYFAFQKTIQQELEKKIVKGTKAFTFNGFGQSMVIRKHGWQKLDSYRGDKLVEDITGVRIRDMSNKDKFRWLSALKYVSKLKIELLAPNENNLEYIQKKYPDVGNLNLPSPEDCQRLLALMKVPNRKIEYIDQIWMGIQSIRYPVFDIGFVDEAQDLSRAELELVTRACKHLVFCGDPNQAIYAFKGADYNMFNRLRKICMLELPLKESFRCPPNIIEKANQLCHAGVRASKGRESGPENRIEHDGLPRHLLDRPLRSCLVLSRTNAPLIRTCLRLVKKEVPAYVRGNDITKSLGYQLKQLRANSIHELQEKIKSKQQYLYNDKKQSLATLVALDKLSCISEVASECNTVDEIEPKLNSLFKFSPMDPCVQLSTIHKAKGLEARHVYILNPPVEHPLGMKDPLQAEQERNLHFVALTRTSYELTWVTE